METLNLFLGSASAPSGSTWNAAIAALVSTGLPIFVILLLGQRATSAFYRGWRPGEGGSAPKRFRISRGWLAVFVPFNLLMFIVGGSFVFREPPIPILAVLGLGFGCFFSVALAIIFNSFIEVRPDAIIYRFGIKTRRVEMNDVKSVYAASFLLCVERKSGPALPLPLILLEDISDLATCLYEHLHKS